MTAFNLAEGIKACRAAYEAGTLQFQGPIEILPNGVTDTGSCTFFSTAKDGKCYTCAVGAMVVPFKDKIIKNDANALTSASSLFTDTLLIKLDVEVLFQLMELQRHHDAIAEFEGERLSDIKDGINPSDILNEENGTTYETYWKGYKAMLLASFLEQLESLEKAHVKN